MEVKVRITDENKFHSLVEKLDIENLQCLEHKNEDDEHFFDGGIQIYLKSDTLQPFYGLINARDFEEEYGFILEGVGS